MEEVNGQVIAPIVSYQNVVGRFPGSYPTTKKRGGGNPSPNVAYHNTSGAWNANSWDWDPSSFVARPLQAEEAGSQGVLLRNENQNGDLNPSRPHPMREDGNQIFLKLGGGDGSAKSGNSGETDSEELHSASKPAKRVRPGSPGVANYPMCQVDGCNENLSTAKDYHRRHKVCELHSKAVEALVGNQTQRFCQQCSRFHPLTEFDAGKRSCRRRLAGHNRRRRKTNPEENNLPLLVPQNRDKNVNNIDLVNLLVVLSQAQRNDHDSNRSFPNKDQLMRIIGSMNSSSPETPAPKRIESPKHVSSGNQNTIGKGTTSPSTQDLLAVFRAASPAPRTHEIRSPHTNTEGSESVRSKSSGVNGVTHLNLHSGLAKEFSYVGGQRSNATSNSPTGDVELIAKQTSQNVPLQLFNLSVNGHPPGKAKSDLNFIPSHSNSSSGGALPFSSEPIVHDFFALQSSRGKLKDGNSPSSEVEILTERENASNFCSTSLQLFGGPTQLGENVSVQSSLDQIEQASTSGSHYSPSTLNSDSQDHTGRIIFKLFNKDPSSLPGSLRTQIYNWLSSSPSDMESYIRPGCILLSLYILMPSIEWDKLDENLLDYLKSLVDGTDAHFWGTGRFLVYTDRQTAASNDGKIRLFKSWKTQSTPELISITPLAVVGGMETSFLLKGRRLLASGTKIHCTHAVGYSIKKQMPSSFSGPIYDEIIMDGFKVEVAAPKSFGRCFIEVENGSRVSSFPIIIADKSICDELKFLEPEIVYTVEAGDSIPTCLVHDEGKPNSRERALHFLNELGWLFQRKQSRAAAAFPDYSLSRLKFLLIFSVERDFCSLVRTLLDILVELNLIREGLVRESMQMLSEIHLLNRAVRRRCLGMVTMLIQYSIVDPTDSSKRYIFLSDMPGPGGITPLHLAATMPSADSMVDALTSDPLEVGLSGWNTVVDEGGLSPYEYATMRNHHSYNSLVARKLADRKCHQVSISVENAEQPQMEVSDKMKPGTGSCSRCAVVAASVYSRKSPGSRTLLHRPFIHSVLAVAAVCVCVCLILRGRPFVRCGSSIRWENLNYGAF